MCDNADAFPDDATETVDTDGDGVGDNSDAFPDESIASIDTEKDGYPDSWNQGVLGSDVRFDGLMQGNVTVSDDGLIASVIAGEFGGVQTSSVVSSGKHYWEAEVGCNDNRGIWIVLVEAGQPLIGKKIPIGTALQPTVCGTKLHKHLVASLFQRWIHRNTAW